MHNKLRIKTIRYVARNGHSLPFVMKKNQHIFIHLPTHNMNYILYWWMEVQRS